MADPTGGQPPGAIKDRPPDRGRTRGDDDEETTRPQLDATMYKPYVKPGYKRTFPEAAAMKVEANICWECSGHLTHVARFRSSAMKAQRTMNLSRGRVSMIPNMKSLSALTVRYSDIYDVTIDADTDTVTKHISEITKTNEDNKIEFKSDTVDSKSDVNLDTVGTKSEVGMNEISNKKNEELPSTSTQTSFTVELKIEPESENEDISEYIELKDLKKECNLKTEYENAEEEWEEMMMQPEVVFFDEEKNSQFTKDDFYVMKTMTPEELEAAREGDRNGARYKFCPYKCETCILGYYHQGLLDKHLAERHSESATHICTICQQHFFSEENLEGHYRSHFNGYRCQICGFSHHRYSMMDVHYIKVHKNSVKRCSPCTLYFPNYRMLKYHRETVHRALPTCAHCGKQYKTKAILKRHLIRHEATEFFECKICHKYYRGKEGLVDHMRRHEAKNKKKEVPSPYCAECDMTFKNIASYKNHLHFSLKHKGPEAMDRYTCSTCGKRFQNKPAVQRHMEAIHLSDMACTICNKWFTREAKLKEHIKFVHEGAQKVKDKICTICGVGFSENRILVGHMRTHTGEKPFSCARCPASFSQSGTLKAHVRVKHDT